MTKRPKIITFGLKADAASQDAIIEALDNREEIIKTNNVVPPYRKRPSTEWFPGIFKPEAEIPQERMELEDYGRLTHRYDCETHVLPESMHDGIYFDIMMLPEHADKMAQALANTFNTACTRVEPLDRGNAHAINIFEPNKTPVANPASLLLDIKPLFDRIPGQRVIVSAKIGDKRPTPDTPDPGFYVNLDILFSDGPSTETAGPFPAYRNDLLIEFLNVLEAMMTTYGNSEGHLGNYDSVPGYNQWFGSESNLEGLPDRELRAQLLQPSLPDDEATFPELSGYHVYYHDGWNAEPYAVDLTIKNT